MISYIKLLSPFYVLFCRGFFCLVFYIIFVYTYKYIQVQICIRGSLLHNMLWFTRYKLKRCLNTYLFKFIRVSIPLHCYFQRDFSFSHWDIWPPGWQIFHGQWGVHPHQDLVALSLWNTSFSWLVWTPSRTDNMSAKSCMNRN